MKALNIKKISTFLLMLFTAGMAYVVTSCNDDPHKYESTSGKPTIHYLRMPDIDLSDQVIEGAYMANTICIVGDNLRSTRKILFNDQEAILNTSFITEHTLLVNVPRELPVNVTDKMYLISKSDTVEYPFTVLIPAPELSSMACEYVKPGDIATINGDFLLNYDDDPMVITMPDGKEVTKFESLSRTSVSFVVPDDCEESGAIVVATAHGISASTKFHFNDNRGIMFEFDGLTGLTNHGWHDREILSDETSISGNFVQLGDGTAVMDANGGWDDNNFAFEYWCGDWNDPQEFKGTDIRLTDLVDFSNWEEMALKFELYIPTSSPWSAGAMQLIFAGTDLVTLGGGGGYPAANNDFFKGDKLPRGLYRPWENTGSFDTNDEWITVTVPFSSFVYGFEGQAATGSLSASSFASFTMFVVEGGIAGEDCTPIFKVDNIRAVPYN